LELEREGRFEEANIEFHRAYTQSPNDIEFKEAYFRTAEKTSEDLLRRYDIYLREKKFNMAFRRLEQAQSLTPNHPKVKLELKKWFRVLLAGKVDLVKIKSLVNQIPLSDQIVLEIRLNTPNISRRLDAVIDYQTKTFNVEDILYDPPQNLLMLYSINSIGVRLKNNMTGRSRFIRFIDFRTPVLVDVKGALSEKHQELTSATLFYPIDLLRYEKGDRLRYSAKGIRYSLELAGDVINVKSSVGHLDFLPQILYINKEDRRYFLDFGETQLFQHKTGGLWVLRREVTKERHYLTDLRNNIILSPYFYFREGGFPFVPASRKSN
jgi:hypothetical protein